MLTIQQLNSWIARPLICRIVKSEFNRKCGQVNALARGKILKTHIACKSKKVRLYPRHKEENRVGLLPVFCSRHAQFEKKLTSNQLWVLISQKSNQNSFSNTDIVYIQKNCIPRIYVEIKYSYSSLHRNLNWAMQQIKEDQVLQFNHKSSVISESW